MSGFTNINDPAGVTALLETLRKSQAWQELDAQNDTYGRDEPQAQTLKATEDVFADNIEMPTPTEVEYPEETSESPSNIFSLLSRLQSGTQTSHGAALTTHSCVDGTVETANKDSILTSSQNISHIPRHADVSIHHSDKPPTLPSASVRNMSFTEALPIIANIASDDTVHEKLKKTREQQNSLEKQLWEERNQLIKNQEEKIKVSQTKAAIIGVDMSENEVKSLQGSFIDELRKFDLERVLPAWDSLVASQQRTFEELSVPGMFLTKNKTEREKQQRIIQVLEGLLSPDSNIENEFEEIEQLEEP